MKKNKYICSRIVTQCELTIARTGKMLEWLKRHAWKACKLLKGFRGSNPRLSAKKGQAQASPFLRKN